MPYEGEEVVLHWANKDQYYIKTSEYLRDYAFRLRPESDANPMRVHFRLADAAEGEHGNIKAAEGKDRVFILGSAGDSGHDFVQLEKVNGQDELVIRFVYLMHAVGEELDPTTAWLVGISQFREGVPWFYELGMKVYRMMDGGKPAEVRKAIEDFRRVVMRLMHSPLGEELMEDRMSPMFIEEFMGRFAHRHFRSRLSEDESKK